MRRCSPSSVRSLSAAAASCSPEETIMSFAPWYRGGGRRQFQRGFSDQRDNGGRGQSMTGDADIMNRELEEHDFRMGSNGRRPYYNQCPPPPYYHNQQHPQRDPRPPFSRGRPFNHNQPFRFHQPSPPQQYNQNPRTFRPPQDIQNPRFPQQPMPAVNQPFRQPPPYYQSPAAGPPRQSQPRPPPALNYRNWEFSGRKPPPNCKRFVVLSYNILADYLALNHRSKLYYHIPRYMMDWDWRNRNIIYELGLWCPDIMCFQEVDLFHDLEKELKLRGYSGIWKMRTGDPVDGCAIFWRTSRFKLLHEEFIEFNKLGLRDNVAQICVLEIAGEVSSEATALPSTPVSNKIVVCNIHVLYNPRRGEIKIGQIRVLLDSAHAVSKSWDNAPIVLCGDFNCTPKSPLYNFISEQQLDLSGVDRDQVSGQASAEIRESRPFFSNNQELPADKSIQDLPKAQNASEHKEPNQEATENNSQKTLNITFHETCSSSNKIEDNSGSLKEGVFPEAQTVVDEVQEKCSDVCSVLAEESTDISSTSNEPDEANISSSMMAGDSLSNPIANIEDAAAALVDEKLEMLSLNELDEPAVEEGGIAYEDDSTFLAALHDGEDSPPLDSSSGLELEPVEEGRSAYDPSKWTPTDIATATGREDCLVLEHKLKLKSTYTEVEDFSRTRDTNGEPLVTSYNSRFMGTVDYIWRSEGLQTVKVLAPIPKEAMQWTQGFPTKKWGSDHIALVSELALTPGVASDDSDQ